jgi:hypothetical protein
MIFSLAKNSPFYIKLTQLLPASWHPAAVKLVAGVLGLALPSLEKKSRIAE